MRRSSSLQNAPDPDAITPERRQHDRVSRANAQIQDSDGRIGQPFIVESLLERWERQGQITAQHRAAGELFARLFRTAQHDPLHAASWLRTGGGKPDTPDHSERARRQIYLAMQACGGIHSPIGAAAWSVLGCELTLRDWCIREGWNGRALNESVGKGILLGALSVLALHFGLERDKSA